MNSFYVNSQRNFQIAISEQCAKLYFMELLLQRLIMVELSLYGTCYNNSNSIRSSLDSITLQFDLNADVELVVVDNFSTDGTYEILKDYAARLKNFKIIRERCSRGRGRQLAYENTVGARVLNIDFDTTYSPILSSALKFIGEEYRTGTIMPMGYADRRTMEMIGGWLDLNYAEDCELLARAVSKGIEIFEFPAIIGENEVIEEGGREGRYASSSIGRLKRYFEILRASIIGNGLTLSRINRDYRGKIWAATILAFIVVRLSGTKIYSYSETGWNWDLVKREIKFLNPEKYGIPKERWFANVQPMLSESSKEAMVQRLEKIGLNRKMQFSDGRIFFFTDETSAELLEKQMKIWKVKDN